MRCERCGTINPDDAGRCVGCGTRLTIPLPPNVADAEAAPQDDVVSVVIPYRNPWALSAYYCGVFGLIPCLGAPLALAAVVLGIAGLVRARRQAAARGRVHAWVGIVLGTLTMLAYVAFVALGATGYLD